MTKREKKAQAATYNPDKGTVNVPTLRLSSQRKRQHESPDGPSTIKRREKGKGREDDKVNADALHHEMARRLRNKISKTIDEKNSLEDLKKTLRTQNRLERGVVTEAERVNNFPAGTIERYIRRQPKTGVQLWIDYVDENFDMMVVAVREQQGFDRVVESNTRGTPANAGKVQSVATPTIESQPTRTITAEMRKVIRNDLPPEVQDQFFKAIQKSLVDVSDYISEYGFKVFSMLLLMHDHEFNIDNTNNISLQKKNGKLLTDFLPDTYKSEDTIYLPPPYPVECIESELFNNQLPQLFSMNHFQIIHSSYFGPLGTKPTTLEKNGILKAFIEAIPPQKDEKSNLDTYLMQKAYSMYGVNFQNLLLVPGRFRKLLNSLLAKLLTIHLAPVRIKEREKAVEKSKKNKEEERKNRGYQYLSNNPAEVSLKKSSYNFRRNLIRNEKKQQAKMLKKYADSGHTESKWKFKADRCELRLKTYRAAVDREREENVKSRNAAGRDEDEIAVVEGDNLAIEARQLEKEDMEKNESGDTSSRRIKALISIIRAVLYQYPQQNIVSEYFQERTSTLEAEEERICLLIANMISPYMPLPQHKRYYQYSLPFFLLSKTVLKAINISSRSVSICPLTKPTQLNALHLDAPSIYSIFSGTAAKESSMSLYDFDGNIISTRMIATEQKDAIFSSFFNLEAIYTLCNSFKHKFGNYIVVLPGLKTVRITNTLVNYPPKNFVKMIPIEQQPQSSSSKTTTQKPKVEKSKVGASITNKSSFVKSEAYKAKERQLQNEIKTLNDQLKKAYEARKKFVLEDTTTQYKKQWITVNDEELRNEILRLRNNQRNENNKVLFKSITDAKREKRRLEEEIQTAKNRLQLARAELYHFSHTTETEDKESKLKGLITKESYKCFEKVECIDICNNLLDKPEHLIFCGVDNGLVSLSEASTFSLRKLEYHLQLFKRCVQQGVEEAKDLSTDDMELTNLPKTFVIKSKDLHFRSGGYALRHNLERAKNFFEDRKIFKTEQILSENPCTSALSIEEAKKAFRIHKQNRRTLQNFYHSNTRTRRKRSYEVRQKVVYDRACAAERKGGKGKRLIMFVGDRGYGVGSAIKGHVKLGGKWKPKLHSLYTSVLETNEHNTSQTCVFCFKKIDHPVKRLSKQGKSTIRTVNGTSVCSNHNCVTASNRSMHMSRDALSALAIGIVGGAMLINKQVLSAFDPKK